jgi:hypothetical protein
MKLFQASKGFATEFYDLRRPLVPLGNGFEQQFEMVARPRNQDLIVISVN